MMHGNVKEVCTRLMESFGEDCPVAVLVWTLEDVLDSAECMDITGEEAGRVLEYIAEDGDHRRYGIGREAVRDMLANLREEDAQTREVTVSAFALAQVLRVAGDYMRLEDAQGGKGTAKRLWPQEHEAIRAMMAALE
ncbi:DUF1380 family protein [Pantoea sp. S61]|uniref:DUF1380 family protein n=1 Tax=Pantoea sp. S61 TaxID=2767442 RepID=UPI00190CE3ED|nr:DUF1380 family protein [Pantoea sp. S61]MBK0127525.1 DUF1380 family protein [Pantoea sp. S61]